MARFPHLNMAKTIRHSSLLRTPMAAVLWVLFVQSPSFGQTFNPPATEPATPQIVFVGLYINDIFQMDLKSSTYVVDFYVWLRWRGNIDPTSFEFVNGSLDLKEHPYSMEIAGEKYISYHCRGTFHAAFDFRRYPLDEHRLNLEMEDATHDSRELQYVVDDKNVRDLPAVKLAGWTGTPPEFKVRNNLYPTTFGDPSMPVGGQVRYSHLSCSIQIFRHSVSLYLKTFLALFISIAIAFLSFVVKPEQTDARFALGVAAIFGAVSSEIVTKSNLPDMPYLTLADKIHLFSLFVIFLSLLHSCLVARSLRPYNIRLIDRIDRILLIAFPISYAVVVVVLTFLS
jgi:hypothetical protein